MTILLQDQAQLQTIVISNFSPEFRQTSTNPYFLSFDVVAVQPLTEKMFQAACANLEVDIIHLDLGSRIDFPVKKVNLTQAIDRGVFFEINFSPALRGCINLI